MTYLIRNRYYTLPLRACISSTNQRQYGVGAHAPSSRLPCITPSYPESTRSRTSSSGAGHRPVTVWFVRQTRELSSVQRPRKTLGCRRSSWRPLPVSPALSSRSFWGLNLGLRFFDHSCSRCALALDRRSPLRPYLATARSLPPAVPALSPTLSSTLALSTLRQPASPQGCRAFGLPLLCTAAIPSFSAIPSLSPLPAWSPIVACGTGYPSTALSLRRASTQKGSRLVGSAPGRLLAAFVGTGCASPS